jgi:hypothetical protein
VTRAAETTEARLRAQLYAAFKHRALLYDRIFDQMRRWREAEAAEADVARLCAIAGRVDNGTVEAAGFEFQADTWQPGRDGCCHLHIRPDKGA